ncbi:MAG: OB-fold domain-containing protein [Rhodobacteraceae bacterium]|nr:OB-fold domain-containing protein [Paracoccaceae bacterium]
MNDTARPDTKILADPFPDARRQGRLLAAECRACGHLFLPFGPVCPRCWSIDIGQRQMSGAGEVATFTIYRQSYHPDFPAPYVLALIALAEGPRLISNVIGCAPEQVHIGMAVSVRFVPRGDQVLPLFVPVTSPARNPEIQGDTP